MSETITSTAVLLFSSHWYFPHMLAVEGIQSVLSVCLRVYVSVCLRVYVSVCLCVCLHVIQHFHSRTFPVCPFVSGLLVQGIRS